MGQKKYRRGKCSVPLHYPPRPLVVNVLAAGTSARPRLAVIRIPSGGLQAKRCALMILRALLALATAKGVQHDRRQPRRCCQFYSTA